MITIRNIVKNICLPSFWKNKLNQMLPEKIKLIYQSFQNSKIHKRHLIAISRIKEKQQIIVAFMVQHDPVWKLDGLYKKMETEKRFKPVIIISPVIYYGEDAMLDFMNKAYCYFDHKKYNVKKTYDEKTNKWLDVKKDIKPDIVFFTNPYSFTKKEYYITNFVDNITYYVPYCFYLTNQHCNRYTDSFYRLLFRNFLETRLNYEIYKQKAYHPENGIFTGYPATDIYQDVNYEPQHIWKHTGLKMKRIIWAPHHTIPNQGVNLNFSSFMVYSDFMIKIAKKYKDKIQFAFKPHPLLKKKLYLDNNWGKEKTDLYYSHWDQMENGQVCESDYVDLFITSDAMILDSISFIAEYLYVNKPSLFIMNNERIEEKLNEFGKLAIKQHYHAYNEEQITFFIENIILQEKDIKKDERKIFYDKYLKPPNSKTATENIFDEVLKIL